MSTVTQIGMIKLKVIAGYITSQHQVNSAVDISKTEVHYTFDYAFLYIHIYIYINKNMYIFLSFSGEM